MEHNNTTETQTATSEQSEPTDNNVLINESVEIEQAITIESGVEGNIGQANVNPSSNNGAEVGEIFREIGKMLKEAISGSIRENTQNVSNQNEAHDNTQCNSKNRYQGSNLSVLPNFYFFKEDRDEAERFISVLRNMAKDGGWSESYSRSVLESKLQNTAKTIYFEGLGNSNGLTLEERLAEFLRLFSHKQSIEESQKSFFSCTQAPRERVIAYKLRLVRLSEPLKTKFRGNHELYDDFLMTQFKQGLIPAIKIEILKKGLTSFDEMVDNAIQFEECLKECTQHSTSVASVETREDQITELQKQIKMLSDKLELSLNTNKDTPTLAPIRHCSGCGRYGHTVELCWREKNSSQIPCDICGRKNHSTKNCYFQKVSDDNAPGPMSHLNA